MIELYFKLLAEVENTAKAAGRDPGAVKLIAVSKTQPFEKILELYQHGHRDFGENYVQELVDKAEQAQGYGISDIRWHFIGHLQTNKVKALVPFVHTIHGVGSLRVAAEIDKRADKHQIISVFIEVNLDGEESKSGVQIPELRKLAAEANAFDHLALHGLMCIPDPNRVGGTRGAFRELARLESELRPLTLGALSMGMSSDYQDAIREGATYVRVGTAIFGERSEREEE